MPRSDYAAISRLTSEAPATTVGFDFTAQMRRVIADMIARLPELAHIELDRVGVGFCQTRKAVQHGRQASLTPLRFAGGERIGTRGRRR